MCEENKGCVAVSERVFERGYVDVLECERGCVSERERVCA